MTPEQCIQQMPIWYEARDAVYLTSGPGQGKTTTLLQASSVLSKTFSKRIGWQLLNGANMNEMDVQGYLVPRHGDAFSESRFTRPPWWITPEGKQLEEYDGGTLIVDEADKLPVECKKILGEACDSNRLGSHVLPEGWVVWMAGNRGEDRSGSTKELDHLINRRKEMPFTITMDGWTDYVTKQGALPITVAFARTNPEVVFQSKVPDKQGPWCTPRSLMRTDRYLQVAAKYNGGEVPMDAVTMENISGSIGEAAMIQFSNTIRLANDMPKLEEIILHPTTVKVPERPDAQMLVAFNLAHRVNQENAGQVIKYVERMPKEFAVTFAKAACNRDVKLVMTPSFQAWAMKNSSLMAIIARKT